MAQNRRTVSKLEFNKRVRDLVSRDSNRLRQTFQKFDKEYASRMAEIHSMQEKVRHSMRNLTQEKMQAREAERGKPSTNDHQGGGISHTRMSNTDERMKHNYKASLPGIQFNRSDHLEVPNRGQARSRRYSLPHPPTFLPGSPKESRALPIHVSHPRTIASSLPKEAFAKPGSPKDTSLMSYLSGSPKESLHGIHLQYPENTRRRKSDYRLSVKELPISLSRSDPVFTAKNKLSPQLDRKGHIVTSKGDIDGDDQNTNTESDKDDTSDDHEESCDKDSQSPRESHITLQRQQITDYSSGHAVEAEQQRGNDSNHVKPKTLLKRTRSSSVPCDPDRLNLKPAAEDNIRSGESRPSRSANHAAGTKRDVSPAIRVFTPQGGVDTSSKPFDELRNCSRRRLIMSTRNEKAKRLNANEDNLLQMEMERFQKQHNKEMKSIILERQNAKEAMSYVRRQRASSLLVARKVLQEINALDDWSDNSSSLSEKVFCGTKQNQASSKIVPGLETEEDRSSCWKTYLLNLTQKEEDLDKEVLDNCNVTSLSSKSDQFGQSRKCAQTFSDGTTASKIEQSSGTLKNTPTVPKHCLPNPPQETSNRTLKSSEYLNVPYLASKIDHFERSPRIRPRRFTESTTDARSDLEGPSTRSGSRLNHMTISRNLANQYREQQGTSAVESVPFRPIESVADDNRARSHSVDSMLFKRVPTPKSRLEKRNLSPNGCSSARSRGNSPEPHSFHSPLILRAALPRTPQMNRRVSSETGSKLLAKRISLEPSHNSSTQSQNKLSPSRGIAKFRQTGSAAAVAQTLVSRYQREKAISNATENLIAEQQRRDKVREEHQQMKDD